MFRDLIRFKQKLSREECEEILKAQKRGVLSVNGEDGYPYGMPLNHYFDEESGKIYFHSGSIGYKLEMLRKDGRVSFCVLDEGTKDPDEWFFRFRSVIVFGRIRLVDDHDTIVDITTRLSHKFTDDEEYIEKEIRTDAKRTILLELTPEYMIGKRVREK